MPDLRTIDETLVRLIGVEDEASIFDAIGRAVRRLTPGAFVVKQDHVIAWWPGTASARRLQALVESHPAVQRSFPRVTGEEARTRP